MEEFNPFAAPASDIAGEVETPLAGPISTDGNQLVVKSGVVLPRFCVKTNTPITESQLQNKKLTWCPNYVIVIFVLVTWAGIIAYLILRKKCSITYGLSAEVKRKYANWFVAKLLAMLLMLGLTIAAATAGYNDAMLVMIILLLISVVVLVLGNSPLSVAKYKDGRFWISGCSREFIERMIAESPREQVQLP